MGVKCPKGSKWHHEHQSSWNRMRPILTPTVLPTFLTNSEENPQCQPLKSQSWLGIKNELPLLAERWTFDIWSVRPLVGGNYIIWGGSEWDASPEHLFRLGARMAAPREMALTPVPLQQLVFREPLLRLWKSLCGDVSTCFYFPPFLPTPPRMPTFQCILPVVRNSDIASDHIIINQ